MVNLKEQVGIKAAEFVTDGMIVGLGTGSTAYYFPLWNSPRVSAMRIPLPPPPSAALIINGGLVLFRKC